MMITISGKTALNIFCRFYKGGLGDARSSPIFLKFFLVDGCGQNPAVAAGLFFC